MTDRRRRMKARGLTDVLTNLFPPPPWTSAALRLTRGGSRSRCDGAPVWSGWGPPERRVRRGAAVCSAGRRRGKIRQNGRSLSESAVALFAQHRSFFRLLLFRKNCFSKNVRCRMGKASVVSSHRGRSMRKTSFRALVIPVTSHKSNPTTHSFLKQKFCFIIT